MGSIQKSPKKFCPPHLSQQITFLLPDNLVYHHPTTRLTNMLAVFITPPVSHPSKELRNLTETT
jgi:hypothetical protein